MKLKKRSPLKANPLRNPGQSIDQHIRELFDDKILSYIFAPVLLGVIAALEWLRWYTNPPPAPLLFTLISIGVSVYSYFRINSYKKRVRKLKLGRDGERAVGQFLETLREKGFRVFHDVVGERFNLDHVIICQHGIFVIETKTYSKPEKGKSEICYKDGQITVNGVRSKSDIVTQAKAEASWLRSTINELTGRSFDVRTIVVFPGWFVESRDNKPQNPVWVLNPKALPKFIENLPKILNKEQMQLAGNNLSRFIRATYPDCL